LFGLELQLARAGYSVGACTDGKPCATRDGTYELTSTRVGPAARFMTSGAKSRIVGTVGLGAAVQHITYEPKLMQTDATGVGSYFEIAGGYELSLGKVLLGVGLRLLAENGSKVNISSITSAGLEIGAGYADW